jgi:hypothetical protein
MEREPIAVQSVKDIQPSGKRWLEDVLGQRLEEDQQVFIMVFTPGVLPDDATRRQALARIEGTLAKVDEHGRADGVTPENSDAAVQEAMEQVRRRQP